MDLACHYAGLAGAAEVAERQATHTGDVGRYVHDVCTRLDAFRGAIGPLRGVYATAVGSACDGLDRSGRAAQRWGRATRDTAADLAAVDALARRVLDRVAELLPGVPDDLVPVAPVAPDVRLGDQVPSALPAALTGPGGSPLDLDRVVRLDTDVPSLLGHAADTDSPALDDVPEADRTTPWRHGSAGPLAEALGWGWDLREAGHDAAGAVEGLGDAMEEAAAAQDDASSYDDFVERAS